MTPELVEIMRRGIKQDLERLNRKTHKEWGRLAPSEADFRQLIIDEVMKQPLTAPRIAPVGRPKGSKKPKKQKLEERFPQEPPMED